MALWWVAVEAATVENPSEIVVFDVIVLAFTERGAKSIATRGVAQQRNEVTGAHSVYANQIDVYSTKVVAINRRIE